MSFLASVFDVQRPDKTKQSMRVILPSTRFSSVNSNVGMLSLLPVKSALAISLDLIASSSPWTREVNSNARISFFSLILEPSQFSISLIVSSGMNVSILMHFMTSASSIFLQYWKKSNGEVLFGSSQTAPEAVLPIFFPSELRRSVIVIANAS